MQEPRKGTPSHMLTSIPTDTTTATAMPTRISINMHMRISPRKLRANRTASCTTDAVPRV